MRKSFLHSIGGVMFAISMATGTPTLAQDSVAANAAKVATDLARDKLATELGIEAGTIEIVSTRPMTWPNSSLGCGKPGTQSLQVITSGHEVILRTAERTHRLHATQKYAVVCGQTEWRSIKGLPTRDLNVKIAQARRDLSQRVGVNESEIRTNNFLRTEWPDTSMECAVAGEEVVKKTTNGYRISLRVRERLYTYHTDLDRVRACPAIATE